MFSKELIEMMIEFEKINPMKCCIVASDAEYDAAISKFEADGLRLACVSNAGLSEPKRRLTFLPQSCFTS